MISIVFFFIMMYVIWFFGYYIYKYGYEHMDDRNFYVLYTMITHTLTFIILQSIAYNIYKYKDEKCKMF